MGPSKNEKSRPFNVDETVNTIEKNLQDLMNEDNLRARDVSDEEFWNNDGPAVIVEPTLACYDYYTAIEEEQITTVGMEEGKTSDLETPVQHDTDEKKNKICAKEKEEEEDDENAILGNVFSYRLNDGAGMLNFNEDFFKLFKLKVKKVLHKGTLGDILLLKDQRNKKLVIKVFSRASGDGMFSKFYGEASALSKLDHPNIIKLYLAVAWPINFGLCLPYYSGGDLLDVGETMAFCDAMRCFVQVTDAVQYLHGRGIVHGDLKVENVAVSKHNQAILLDFGQAMTITDTSLVDRWQGTHGCIAPEKFLGKPMCAYKMDIWSLGVILWDLLTMPVPHLSKLRVNALFVETGKLMVVKRPYRYILERLLDVNPQSRATAEEAKESLSQLVLCPRPECRHGTSRPLKSTATKKRTGQKSHR